MKVSRSGKGTPEKVLDELIGESISGTPWRRSTETATLLALVAKAGTLCDLLGPTVSNAESETGAT